MEGMDCVGMLYGVAAGVGLHTVPVTNYRHAPGSAVLIPELERYCTEVEDLQDMRPGDILVVTTGGEDPQHTMILTRDNTVIHASARHRKVVEHRLDDKTRNGIAYVYRFKDVT
jgi:cell wall-associated NlpC family hydrolase